MKKRMKIICAACLFISLLAVVPGPASQARHAQAGDKEEQDESPFVPGRVLVRFRPALSAESLIATSGTRDAGEIARTGVRVLELPEGADERAFVKALQSRPEVEFAELDRVLEPAEMIPNDPWYVNEWALPKISAPSAWAITSGSSAVTIAIIDTGVDASHEDLASKLVPGRNIYNNNSDTGDVYGHGTKVAGAAAASSNNAIGVTSVAWGCRVMPIRVSAADGTASYSNIAGGLTWAADHGARVANISYIVSGSSTVTSAAQYFQSKGGVVTVSAGNYGTFDSSADNPYLLTVSASGPDDALYSWSNTGNNVDLAAPGSITTTLKGGGYSIAIGTSISAPIAAGVAALVLSANPGLTPGQVRDILKQSADDLGSAGWDSRYGHGRLNAARAVNIASGGPGEGPADATPPIVDFTSPANTSAVSGAVSLQVSATDNVGVTSVSVNVDGVALGARTAAPYNFSWNTVTAANGSHTLTASATDAAGNRATASIIVTVSNLGDTSPPSINITSPTGGPRVSANSSVSVNASDNVGVTRVELYVDGQLKATATSAPFTTKWNTKPYASGAHTLQCKAYDAAGNAGASQVVTVYK